VHNSESGTTSQPLSQRLTFSSPVTFNLQQTCHRKRSEVRFLRKLVASSPRASTWVYESLSTFFTTGLVVPLKRKSTSPWRWFSITNLKVERLTHGLADVVGANEARNVLKLTWVRALKQSVAPTFAAHRCKDYWLPTMVFINPTFLTPRLIQPEVVQATRSLSSSRHPRAPLGFRCIGEKPSLPFELEVGPMHEQARFRSLIRNWNIGVVLRRTQPLRGCGGVGFLWMELELQ